MSEKKKSGYWRRKDKAEGAPATFGEPGVPPAATPRSTEEETVPPAAPATDPGESGGWSLKNFDQDAGSRAPSASADEPASGQDLDEPAAPEGPEDDGPVAADSMRQPFWLDRVEPSASDELEPSSARPPEPSGTPVPDGSPLERPQGPRASPDLAWLNEGEGDDAWRMADQPDADSKSDASDAAGEPDEPRKPGRRWPLAAAILVLAAITAYLALTPRPLPRSAALEAEHSAGQMPEAAEPEIGAAEPLPPPGTEPAGSGPVPAAEETSGAAELPEEGTPIAEPMTPEPPASEPVQTGRPAAAPVTEPPRSRLALEAPPATAPAPGGANGEALALIVRKLEAQQAQIERLERGERVLRDRLEGLEIAAESEAPRAVRPPRPAQPVSRKSRPDRVPPETTSLPVKNLTQRRSATPKAGAPLPFSVESVDRLNGESIIVVRAGGRLVDLKPGDSHGGWRIESAAGQTVTIRSPEGGERTVRAGGGSEP